MQPWKSFFATIGRTRDLPTPKFLLYKRSSRKNLARFPSLKAVPDNLALAPGNCPIPLCPFSKTPTPF